MAPVVGLYFVSGNRLSYSIAKTLSLGGCRTVVRCEVSQPELADETHPGFSDRQYSLSLYSDSDIEVVPNVSQSPPLDALLFGVCRTRPRYPAELRALMRQTRKVAAWNTAAHEYKYTTNLRSELSVLSEYWSFLVRSRTVVMGMGRVHARPTGLFGRAKPQGYFVHPSFLLSPALRHQMFESAWQPDAFRAIRLIFSGSATGLPVRESILKQILERIQPQSNIRLFYEHDASIRFPADAQTNERLVMWLPTSPELPNRIDLQQWPAMLRDCDFCLCPPGAERKTHRVIESLLQGAIPILDCPDDYDIGLIDGVNCLVALHGDWSGAVQRALACERTKIVLMRRAIADLVHRHLNEQAMARRWLNVMGVKP
jgi:hypothetical protein